MIAKTQTFQLAAGAITDCRKEYSRRRQRRRRWRAVTKADVCRWSFLTPKIFTVARGFLRTSFRWDWVLGGCRATRHLVKAAARRVGWKNEARLLLTLLMAAGEAPECYVLLVHLVRGPCARALRVCLNLVTLLRWGSANSLGVGARGTGFGTSTWNTGCGDLAEEARGKGATRTIGSGAARTAGGYKVAVRGIYALCAANTIGCGIGAAGVQRNPRLAVLLREGRCEYKAGGNGSGSCTGIG